MRQAESSSTLSGVETASGLPNADGGHHAAGDALAAKAEEQVRATCGAVARANDIVGGHARVAQN